MQVPKIGSSRFTAGRQTGTGKHYRGIVQQAEYGVNG